MIADRQRNKMSVQKKVGVKAILENTLESGKKNPIKTKRQLQGAQLSFVVIRTKRHKVPH